MIKTLPFYRDPARPGTALTACDRCGQWHRYQVADDVDKVAIPGGYCFGPGPVLLVADPEPWRPEWLIMNRGQRLMSPEFAVWATTRRAA